MANITEGNLSDTVSVSKNSNVVATKILKFYDAYGISQRKLAEVG